eukprot:6192686-Pleurochrysis_carterae.AAC.6
MFQLPFAVRALGAIMDRRLQLKSSDKEDENFEDKLISAYDVFTVIWQGGRVFARIPAEYLSMIRFPVRGGLRRDRGTKQNESPRELEFVESTEAIQTSVSGLAACDARCDQL